MALPREVEVALAKLEKDVAAAFAQAISQITSKAQLAAIVGHLRAGDVDMAMASLRIDPRFFEPLDRAIEAAYLQGGVQALASLPAIPDPYLGGNYNLSFDGRHPRAEAWVRTESSTLITRIVDDQREVIRAALEQGLRDGVNPRTIALDIIGRVDPLTGRRTGGIVGLTQGQKRAARRAADELRNGDYAAYLRRARRDRRFDAAVKRAMRTGDPIPSSTVDRIIGRYRDRLLQLRGETIARTEALNALRAGRHEGFVQLLDSGAVRSEQVTRVWDATGDARTREDHAAMEGQEVQGMDQPFTAPDGSQMMYPGDISLGAAADQTIQCRCFEDVRIDYLADRVDETPLPETPSAPTFDADAAVERASQADFVSGQDAQLNAFVKEREGGFLGAQVVSDEDFRSRPEAVMYRGLSRAEYLDANVSGDFSGLGIFGNGQYFAVGDNRAAALEYADGRGTVYAAKLSDTARVANYDDLLKEARENYGNLLMSGADERVTEFLGDVGRYAAYQGYDAVYVAKHDYMVVVNPSALIVPRTTVADGGISFPAHDLTARQTQIEGIVQKAGTAEDASSRAALVSAAEDLMGAAPERLGTRYLEMLDEIAGI